MWLPISKYILCSCRKDRRRLSLFISAKETWFSLRSLNSFVHFPPHENRSVSTFRIFECKPPEIYFIGGSKFGLPVDLFFQFHGVFKKFWQIYGLSAPKGCPLSSWHWGKSYTCPCIILAILWMLTNYFIPFMPCLHLTKFSPIFFGPLFSP